MCSSDLTPRGLWRLRGFQRQGSAHRTWGFGENTRPGQVLPRDGVCLGQLGGEGDSHPSPRQPLPCRVLQPTHPRGRRGPGAGAQPGVPYRVRSSAGRARPTAPSTRLRPRWFLAPSASSSPSSSAATKALPATRTHKRSVSGVCSHRSALQLCFQPGDNKGSPASPPMWTMATCTRAAWGAPRRGGLSVPSSLRPVLFCKGSS